MKTSQNRFMVRAILLRAAAKTLRRDRIAAHRATEPARLAIETTEEIAAWLEVIAATDEATLKAAHALADAVMDHLALQNKRRMLAVEFRSAATKAQPHTDATRAHA